MQGWRQAGISRQAHWTVWHGVVHCTVWQAGKLKLAPLSAPTASPISSFLDVIHYWCESAISACLFLVSIWSLSLKHFKNMQTQFCFSSYYVLCTIVYTIKYSMVQDTQNADIALHSIEETLCSILIDLEIICANAGFSVRIYAISAAAIKATEFFLSGWVTSAQELGCLNFECNVSKQHTDLDLDLKVLFLDQKLVPPLKGPSLTYKFSGGKWNPNNQYQLPCCWSGFI